MGLGLPADGWSGSTPAGSIERAGFRVRAIASAHEAFDRDDSGRHPVSRVRHRGRRRPALSQRRHDAVRRAGRVAGRRVGSTCCSCRSTAATPRGASPATCRPPRPSTWPARVRPAVRGPSSLRYVYVQHRSGRTSSRPRPAGCRPGPSPRVLRCGERWEITAVSITLGIDVGTSGTKTLAIDEQRRDPRVGLGRSIRARIPKPGWSEQDPELWWDATVETLRAVLATGNFKPADVAGVGLSGQMHGSVFLDAIRRGRSAPPCSGTTSGRPRSATRSSTRAGGREALIRMVGNRAPDRLHRAQAPLGPQARAGELGPRPPGASAQGLHPLPADRDVRHRGQRRLGHAAARRRQPPMERRTARQARPRPRAAARLLREPRGLGPGERDRLARPPGLPVGTPVVGGGGDQPAGAVGNGIVRPGVVSATMGTSGVVFAHTDKPGFDPLGRLQRGCHAVPGAWHVMGVVLAAGGQLPVVPQRAGQGRGRAGQGRRASTRTSCSPARPPSSAPGPRGCSSCPT